MSGLTVTLVTIALIVLSAFFVAIEFALIAAKRHRLEDLAGTSPAARAALRNASELSLLLAGSQLGITLCTLALGAITKPAMHHALMPLLEATGLPYTAADVAAFILALTIVTFLHLVIGEMAPKSWAIAHPERSAVLLSLPMRGFMTLVRPLLRLLNHTANVLVQRLGATPVDELASGQDVAGLRQLVEHSAEAGTIGDEYRSSIEHALDLRERTVAELMPRVRGLTSVDVSADFGDVQEQTRRTGHRRVLVREGQKVVGVVHVRDTLGDTPLTTPVHTAMQPVLEMEATTPLHEAVGAMREGHRQLAVITSGATQVGVVTLSDILPGLMPPAAVSADDENTTVTSGSVDGATSTGATAARPQH